MSVDVLVGGPGLIVVVEDVGTGISSLLLSGPAGFSAVLLGPLSFEGLERFVFEVFEGISMVLVNGTTTELALSEEMVLLVLLGWLEFDGILVELEMGTT